MFEYRVEGVKMQKKARFKVAAWAAMIFLIWSSCPLKAASERRGATVTVTLTDGNRVKGELLAVRTDFLLVYDRDARLGKASICSRWPR